MRRPGWGTLAVAAAVLAGAALVLWPDDPPERTAYLFTFDEPGLHADLGAAALPPEVRVRTIVGTPDGRLGDPRLAQAFGGHLLERMQLDLGPWSDAGPAVHLEVAPSDPPELSAKARTAQEPLVRSQMEAFLAEVLAEPSAAPGLASAWHAQALAYSERDPECALAPDVHDDEAPEGAGPTGQVPDGAPGQGGQAEACEPFARVGTQWRLVTRDVAFDAKAWYERQGGLDAAHVSPSQQGYGALGRLLRWGDRAMGISVETMVLDGPEDDPWHMLVDRGGHATLLLPQTQPWPQGEAKARLAAHLEALGVADPQVHGLQMA